MVDPKAVPDPVDYDTDPARSRTDALAKYGFGGDIHEDVANRIEGEGLQPCLDVGCGTGALMRPLYDRRLAVIGLDASPTQLDDAPHPRVLGDARLLPFSDESFNSVAALYMLYHLPEPQEVIAECYRVLKKGGLFAACAPSRYNDPELSPFLPDKPPSTFDAESAFEMVERLYRGVSVDTWDLPYYHLPDEAAVELYLYGRQYPRDVARRVADQVELPLTITKRGAVFYGYKRP